MTALLASMAVLLSVISAENPGKLVIGQTFMAGSTDPTSGSTAWALTSHGIAEKLFTVDQAGKIVGQVAESVVNLDKLSWEVTLKAGYLFSDGTQVTPQHVADALTELNSVNSNAKATLGDMTVTPLAGLKVKIQSQRSTPVMDAVLAEFPFVVYLKKSGKMLFTGPFAVKTFVAGERFDLIPNQHYTLASERPEVTIKKFSDGHAVASALEKGELDMAFHLPVDSLPGLRQKKDLTIKSFEVGYHYMMFHNIRKPHMSDFRVRRALDIAIDRSELAKELQGGRATRSLFPDYTPYFSDDTQQQGDKKGAEDLLDAAGWVKAANGARMKDGAALTLDLVAYPQRPGLVIMQPLIKKRLAALGIAVTSTTTSGKSWDQLDQIIAGKNFDLLMWAQNTLPAGDPQWFLNAFFRSDAGSNHAGLKATAVDGLLDELATKSTPSDRVSATAAVHKAILDEVPVSNLVTPEWHVGLSSRLSAYEPWGSDYYVIRADLRLSQTSKTHEGHEHANGAGRASLGALSAAGLWLLASML